MKHLLSQIPAINKILMTEEVKQLLEEYPEVFVKDIVKKETENIKNEILNNNLSEVPSMEEIIEKINLSVKKNYKGRRWSWVNYWSGFCRRGWIVFFMRIQVRFRWKLR